MTVVRERPPLRLMLDVASPGGVHTRWGLDEHNPANVPSGLTFSSTMPGGFEQLSCTLARQPGLAYADLAEFSTVTVHGAGGQVAWQGRLETTPRVSGDQMAVSPGAVGWQAALTDDQSATQIFIDCDLTRWQPMSVQRKLNLVSTWQGIEDATATADATTGAPALVTQLTGNVTSDICEAFYDAKGLLINALYYAWRKGASVTLPNANWSWAAALSNDDIESSIDTSGNLASAGPGTGTVTPGVLSRKFALVQFAYTPAALPAGNFPIAWTYLGVVGYHGLPIRGSLGSQGGIGVYASDVVQWTVNAWAPRLATSRAGASTIEQSTFIIPQLAFLDPTTAADIIAQATQYGLPDWWVDEGPTFNLASRENHGRNWRARVGPSGLAETGPQVDRLFNSVIVSYRDVSGVTRTVGPTGSGANTIDDTLADPDPLNPVTAAGLKRRSLLAMGIVSTPAGAIKVGQDWLAEQKLLSTAGQAQIIGHVQDDHGIWFPAWAIRAGDRVTFTDAHDPVARRVVRASYTDSTRTCQLDLDSPPEGLQALLARLSVSLTPLGL